MIGSNCGQLVRLDPVQGAFLSISLSDDHLPTQEPHYYAHCTEEERETEAIAMSPETVIVKAEMRARPSNLGSSYITTAVVGPWG